MSRSKPRVLHVLGSLNRGGVENWLISVLRHSRNRDAQFDFAVHLPTPGAFDEEVLGLGSRIHRLPLGDGIRRYAWRLGSLLRRSGPFDVVHSHVHHFSGIVLLIARCFGVRGRLAHSHSDTSRERRPAWPRRLYERSAARLIRLHASLRLAASAEAAAALYGPDWNLQPRCRILHYGIELGRFAEAHDRASVLRDLSLPPDAKVLGHVGRFHPVKNHAFVVEVAREVMSRDANTWLLLVGDGPDRSALESRIREAGIANRSVLAGQRTDVPRLLAAMDCFVFPSHWEGLPIALIEAQAAGVPAVVAEHLTREADIIPGLVTRLPLGAGPRAWADVARGLCTVLPPAWEARRETIMRSHFSIQASYDDLLACYRRVMDLAVN